MTTSQLSPSSRGGDACPSWCAGEHVEDRDDRTDPEDQGTWHYGPKIDEWAGTHPDAHEPLSVSISGFRHDSGVDDPTHGYIDEITVEGSVNPGFLSSVALPVTDARRLATALILACDLAEGGS